ncbi:MAG: hypothetical protein GX309_05800 [Clostridiales bacterium]|nr:hypothetical protein [Clostridiales bacterium]
MYKLNLTEIELRKKTIDKTKDNMVHTKNNVLIDNDVKDNSKKNEYNKKNSEKKRNKARYITVDAVKCEKVEVNVQKDNDFVVEKPTGTFIDSIK